MTGKKKSLLEFGLCGNANLNDVGDLERFGIFLDSRQNFYEAKIKGKKFKEFLGIYYQEELDLERNKKENNEQGEKIPTTGTPDTNKTKKRVITYQEIG